MARYSTDWRCGRLAFGKEISVELMGKMEARSPTSPELDAIYLKMNMIGFRPAKAPSRQQRRLTWHQGGSE